MSNYQRSNNYRSERDNGYRGQGNQSFDRRANNYQRRSYDAPPPPPFMGRADAFLPPPPPMPAFFNDRQGGCPNPPPAPYYPPENTSWRTQAPQKYNENGPRRSYHHNEDSDYRSRTSTPGSRNSSFRRDDFGTPGSRKRTYNDRRESDQYDSRRSNSSYSERDRSTDGRRPDSSWRDDPRHELYDGIDHDSPAECTDEELRFFLRLQSDDVPNHVGRMRALGPMGYPPAFTDDCVRVSATLPFFVSTSTEFYRKRELKHEDLRPIRGFTHVKGDRVSDDFLGYMQRVADADYACSNQKAVKQAETSGFNITVDEEEIFEEKLPMEPILFDVPRYDLEEDKGYAFGDNTKKMKHTLDGFRDGIQPFIPSEPNTPSNFMSKLRNLISRKQNKEDGELDDSRDTVATV